MIEKISLKEKVDSIDTLFSYLRVGALNNHMLNVLKAENRILEFHIHEKSDEMFYCIEEVKGWLDKQIKRYKEYGFGLWAVVLKKTGIMIG